MERSRLKLAECNPGTIQATGEAFPGLRCAAAAQGASAAPLHPGYAYREFDQAASADAAFAALAIEAVARIEHSGIRERQRSLPTLA
jgi:hypothetical protein